MKNPSILKQRMTVGVVALGFGLCFSTFLLFYALDFFIDPPLTSLIWIILALVLAIMLFFLLDSFIKEQLQRLPKIERWAVAIVSAVAGTLILRQSPIKLESDLEALLGRGLASDGIALLLYAAVGGSILLVTLLLVISIESEHREQFYIVSLLMVTYVLVGVHVYRDYGISADEGRQQKHGHVAWANIAPNTFGYLSDEALADYNQRHYGVAQHLPIVVLEEANQLGEMEQWHLRHYLTFLLCVLGALAMYRLGKDAFHDWRLGLASMVLFVLNPRFFAESFYNIKDLVFASMFAISLYFGLRYWRERKLIHAALFGLILAFATTIRFIGIGLLLVVIVIAVFDNIFGNFKEQRWALLGLPLMLIVFQGTYIVMSPAAYDNPLGHLPETITRFSDYQSWNGRIMYMGEFIPGQDLPWHYLPVWFLITVPIWGIVLFSVALGRMIVELVQKKSSLLHSEGREPFIYLALMVAPVLAGIVQGSTLYNGWRQVFFIYVPFVLLAVYGVQTLYIVLWRTVSVEQTRNIAIYGLSVFLIVTQLYLLRWIIVHHPYQNVYFTPAVNLFGGREGFERDYWQLAVKQAMEHILEVDEREQVGIAPENWMLEKSPILGPEAQARIIPGNVDSADYVIQMYRSPEQTYDLPVFYEVDVDGLTIMTIHVVE